MRARTFPRARGAGTRSDYVAATMAEATGPSVSGGEALYYVSTPPERPSPGLQCLLDSVDTLPCWLPHRAVADALGFSHSAIEAAEARLGGKGYRWASEFENVHSLWPFKEPGFVVHGIRFAG